MTEPQWIVWQRMHIHDPTIVSAFLAIGNDGLDPWRLSNSKLNANVIVTIPVIDQDIGKPLDVLKTMERYQLPVSYTKTIDGDTVKAVTSKPKLSKDEADRLGVTLDGKPKDVT